MALTPEKDVSREGISSDKILAVGRLLVPDNNQALVKVDDFTSINLQRIQQITGRRVDGVILDVDETVARHHGEILPENEAHIIGWTREGVKVLINSNMKASDRYDGLVNAAKGMVIVHCSQFSKPSEENFKECRDVLGLPEENLLMVGDNPMTDGGSVRTGIPFAQVTPVPTNEGTLSTIKRSPQLVTRAAFRGLSAHFDFLYDRRVLRDKDMTFGLKALLEAQLNKNLLDGLSDEQLRSLDKKYIGLLGLLESVEVRIYKLSMKANRNVELNSQLEKRILSNEYEQDEDFEEMHVSDLRDCLIGNGSVDYLIELQEIIIQQILAEFKKIEETKLTF
ncbi:hypothetical protein ACFL3T_04425 [Patescibacteria group bacterium]